MQWFSISLASADQMKTRTRPNGFSLLQLLITVAVIAIVVSFGFIGIRSARASIRLSNSARQFAVNVERARADAVRRHDTSGIQQVDGTTYSITMDFGLGIVTTQNFSLESGVAINLPRTVIFDWRGRTPVETSVGFNNESGTANVDITGAGDVTIDAQIFHDGSIPPVTLNGAGGGVLPPDPTPVPNASPAPSPSPTSTPTPTPNPTPTPTPNPTPTPTQPPCSLSASPSAITISRNASGTVSVYLVNHIGSGTISASSSNSGQIQVAPSSQTVTGTNSASFTITVKAQSGSVTFSSSCGSRTVNVTVN